MGDTKKPEPAPALPDGWEWSADGIAETITPGGVVRRVRVDRDGDVEVDTYAPARVVLAVLARAGYGGGEPEARPTRSEALDALDAAVRAMTEWGGEEDGVPEDGLVGEAYDHALQVLGQAGLRPIEGLPHLYDEDVAPLPAKPPALPADVAEAIGQAIADFTNLGGDEDGVWPECGRCNADLGQEEHNADCSVGKLAALLGKYGQEGGGS